MDEAQCCLYSPFLPNSQDQLIPGLPDCVVLDCLLPRVPWHSRAILTITSKAWKHALQEPHKFGELTRRAQAVKLQRCFILVHEVSEEAALDCYKKMNTKRHMPRPLAISVLEEDTMPRVTGQDQEPSQNMCGTDEIWTQTKLPPIPACAPLRILHDCGIACLHGQIFVMGGWDPRTDAVYRDVYMLNIAAGLWEWEAMPPMHFPRAFFHCTTMAGKIYVMGGTSSAYAEHPDPEVFNVLTQTWELLPRVTMSRDFHFNGLFVCRDANLVLVHGFCTMERGDLVTFRRAYDQVSGMWVDCECVDDVGDGVAIKFDTQGGGFASKGGNDSGGVIVHEHRERLQAQCRRGAIVSMMAM